MLLQNARLENGEITSVRILEGVITELSPQLCANPQEVVLDCQNKTLLPSLIDLGVFLHNLNASTYTQLKQQAYKGGVGTLMGIPLALLYSLNEPRMEPLSVFEDHQDNLNPLDYGAVQKALVDGDLLCLHPLNSQQRLQNLSMLCDQLLERTKVCLYIYNIEGQKLLPALDYAKMLNLPLVCGVRGYEGRSSLAMLDESPLAYELGLPSVSRLIQVKEVGKYAGLALHTKLSVLLDSVVELDALQVAQAFKSLGAPLWVQTPLHHLILDESIYKHYDPRSKILPPLKSKTHQEQLQARLDQIDILTSLHYTHIPRVQIFEDAPFGMNSIDLSFALAYTFLIKPQIITLARLVELMASNPARLLGLDYGVLAVGKQARLMLVDLEQTFKVSNPASIYEGQMLQGRVEWVLQGEQIVYTNHRG
ncbi:amidohydrolase family protein [Helicobacter bizzozeronii]|uniref:amidohydrolase family protein n=1 Tax=Helicobacter bizzozeronii TaxID=56877 RepID=UPI000CF14E45|nr:amidohydrolase family protein [Helicobacter bizzozeronii]